MPFCMEMHFHTAEVSPCGNVPAAEAVRAYRERGYSGVVVTDHYAKYNFDRFPGSWTDKLAAWLTGYRAAKHEGEAIGLAVLLGMELRLGGDNAPVNEYLVYGVTEGQLAASPALWELDEPGLAALARENGWLVAQAHPFRPGMRRPLPFPFDGVEVYNGNKRHNSHNEEARAFCREQGRIPLSGSDFHEWEDLARGGLRLEEPIAGSAALIRTLRAGTYGLIETP